MRVRNAWRFVLERSYSRGKLARVLSLRDANVEMRVRDAFVSLRDAYVKVRVRDAWCLLLAGGPHEAPTYLPTPKPSNPL